MQLLKEVFRNVQISVVSEFSFINRFFVRAARLCVEPDMEWVWQRVRFGAS
jgi:hypothetical protein